MFEEWTEWRDRLARIGACGASVSDEGNGSVRVSWSYPSSVGLGDVQSSLYVESWGEVDELLDILMACREKGVRAACVCGAWVLYPDVQTADGLAVGIVQECGAGSLFASKAWVVGTLAGLDCRLFPPRGESVQ